MQKIGSVQPNIGNSLCEIVADNPVNRTVALDMYTNDLHE